MKARTLKILLIDESEECFCILDRELKKITHDYTGTPIKVELFWETSFDAALGRASSENFDVAFLGLSPLETTKQAAFQQAAEFFAAQPLLPVIILGPTMDEESEEYAIRLGAQNYFVKDQLASINLRRSMLFAIDRQIVRGEVEVARSEALKLAEDRNRFLSQLSHEIRTPLTSIIGFAELLGGPALSVAEQKDAIGAIRTNANYLYELINNVLDLAKFEAGKIDLHLELVSPHEVVSAVGSMLGRLASAKGLALQIDYEFPLPEYIRTDATRFKQILINLVGNAIKFTEAGSVTIKVWMDTGSHQLLIEVIDTGVGLTDEEQKLVFDRFVQADTGSRNASKGTGLGLSISRKIAKTLKGDVFVTSKKGNGAKFTLSLPCGRADSVGVINSSSEYSEEFSNPSSRPTQNKAGATVLVADDDRDIRQLLTHFATQAGLKVESVSDGKSALDKALENQFDIILMDINMPNVGGYECVQTLRAKNYHGPVIALTADTSQTCTAKCFDSGFDGFLAKPFRSEDLFSLIGRHIGSTTGLAPTELEDLEHNSQFQKVVDKFVSGLDSRVDAMTSAIEKKDWELAEMQAHKLKAAGLFGFPAIARNASRVEVAVKARDESRVHEKFEGLKDIIKGVIESASNSQ